MAKYNCAITQCLEQGHTPNLGATLKHVAYLAQLSPLLLQALPTELAEFCQLANYRQGRLVLSVSNQAIATKLRFILPSLRQSLRQHKDFAALVGIDFYVTKPIAVGLPSAPSVRLPSNSKPKQNLATLLTQIDDPALRESWASLVQNLHSD